MIPAMLFAALHSAACSQGLGSEACDRRIAVTINAACPDGYTRNAGFLPCRIGERTMRRHVIINLTLAYEHGVDLLSEDARHGARN